MVVRVRIAFFYHTEYNTVTLILQALWELPGLRAFCGSTTKCPTASLSRRFPRTHFTALPNQTSRHLCVGYPFKAQGDTNGVPNLLNVHSFIIT